ncbi:MAG: hypothetical protein BWX70_03527 [Verrucomicrobia bacterium ADurb.Bin070]|nr:MAG: hypothetical protein BWX70_03527 [Verrucomicrobia bacterium ADurb.Bin070]
MPSAVNASIWKALVPLLSTTCALQVVDEVQVTSVSAPLTRRAVTAKGALPERVTTFESASDAAAAGVVTLNALAFAAASWAATLAHRVSTLAK